MGLCLWSSGVLTPEPAREKIPGKKRGVRAPLVFYFFFCFSSKTRGKKGGRAPLVFFPMFFIKNEERKKKGVRAPLVFFNMFFIKNEEKKCAHPSFFCTKKKGARTPRFFLQKKKKGVRAPLFFFFCKKKGVRAPLVFFPGIFRLAGSGVWPLPQTRSPHPMFYFGGKPPPTSVWGGPVVWQVLGLAPSLVVGFDPLDTPIHRIHVRGHGFGASCLT